MATAARKTNTTRQPSESAPELMAKLDAATEDDILMSKPERLKPAVYSTAEKQYPILAEKDVPEKVMNALREADGIIAASLPKIPSFKAEYKLFPSLENGEWTFVLEDLRYVAKVKA